MDGHREYYTKWNKSHRKKQIPNDFIYMWKLKNKTNEETQNTIIKKKKIVMGMKCTPWGNTVNNVVITCMVTDGK